MDFWKTEPAKVEAKRAAGKRSAAKSMPKAAAVAQADAEVALPSGSEGHCELECDAGFGASLPSPAGSDYDDAGPRQALKRPAASETADAPVLKRPSALRAFKRPAASAAPAPNVAVAANEAPAPVVAGEVRDGEVVNLRGNLKVLLPQDVALGCPKCRNSRVGCQTCRVAKGLRLIGGFWDCF